MKAYIKENDANGKDAFQKAALDETTEKYNPKKARDYFCEKYPEAVLVSQAKKVEDATAKLMNW